MKPSACGGTFLSPELLSFRRATQAAKSLLSVFALSLVSDDSVAGFIDQKDACVLMKVVYSRHVRGSSCALLTGML